MKAFADDFNVAEVMFSVYDKIENIVGKGENAGYQHFHLKGLFCEVIKSWDSVERDTGIPPGPEVMCGTCNIEVPGSSRTGSTFLEGVSLGKAPQSPNPMNLSAKAQ